MGDPKAFPDQMEYTIPPACSGSAWRGQGVLLPGGHALNTFLKIKSATKYMHYL